MAIGLYPSISHSSAISINTQRHHNTTAVCIIVRDEERGIGEWLAYQKVIGFDQIFVYNNGSKDRTADIALRAAAQDRSIVLIDWPDSPERKKPQIAAYNDVLKRSSTEWIAFFDADEFLVFDDPHMSIGTFISTYPEETGAIAVNWRIFGSSGRQEPGDGLVIERFLRCGPEHHTMSNYCKSIVRRRSVQEMKVHVPVLHEGQVFDSTGSITDIDRDCRTARKNHRIATLNHYALKSRTEFSEKCARGRADAPKSQSEDHLYRLKPEYWNALDQNHIEKTDALIHVESIKRMMKTLDISH